MAFSFTREDIPADNLTWLGSKHAVGDARTITLDGTKFTALADKGIIPSGIALTEGAGGLFAPATDATKVDGFLLTQQKLKAGNIVAPMLDHGRIIAAKAPEQSVDVKTIDNPLFVIVGKAPAGDVVGG
ncbi:hypothetical protein [Corynebacterium freneyi]|uniref:Head decoration protein n=1 Tax=Corynebacterium freneyi TaxID=134034 RepID=A0ABS4U9T2_9CORY|nr:hypothetical protein [Corynebacterium freneyi]MBP2333297.1 hypothetical protein [Corynebacterium freneyi]QXA52651.1 hypothetical protein I6L56_11495 [Corynebacterium freneyi]WJZ04599.1 hypothetical protein CFREN_03065 [Corynebacterium freneyi]